MSLDEALEAVGKGVDVAGILIIVVGALAASGCSSAAPVAAGHQTHTFFTAGT